MLKIILRSFNSLYLFKWFCPLIRHDQKNSFNIPLLSRNGEIQLYQLHNWGLMGWIAASVLLPTSHETRHHHHLHLLLYINIYIQRDRHRNRYRDSLRAGRSGDRIPVRARFPAPVQTGPGAHSISYTMGTGSFPGVKRTGRGADHPPHLAPRLKKE